MNATRRTLLTALAAASLGARPARAAMRPRRIYMATWRGITDVERGFQEYLAQRGVPVEYIWRDAGQNRARIAEFAREAHELRPDLVYTWGTSATLGMVGTYEKPFALGAPVVFALVADPVGSHIVPSLSAQGRDVTGVYHVAPVEAQLRAMRAYRPFERLGILYNPAESNSLAITEDLERAMTASGGKLLQERFATDAADQPLADGLEERVLALHDAGAEWLYLGPDSFLYTCLDRVAAAAAAQRMPTFATTESLIASKAPVLAGLVSRYRAVGEFTAFKAEQILGGKPARDIAVETLSRFVFIVRVEVARNLGFLPPVTLFNYAEFR